MTSPIYFPEQRHLLPKSTIRRQRMLPDFSNGETIVNTGARVSLHDPIARGSSPAPYVLIDALGFFKLKDPDAIYDLLEARVGDQVGDHQRNGTGGPQGRPWPSAGSRRSRGAPSLRKRSGELRLRRRREHDHTVRRPPRVQGPV